MKAKATFLLSSLLGAWCLLCVGLLIVLTPSSQGAVPQLINYQGVLKDFTGVACEGDATAWIGKSGGSLISNDNGNKIIMYRDKIPIEVDYDKGVLIVQGKEIPIIVDGDVKIVSPATKSWVYLPYDRFDIYIEENYYSNNTDELNLFFDRFELRYELMESLTGWSSEKFYGEKLEIYVESTPGCYGGYASPTQAHILLHEDLSNLEICKVPYFVDGIPYYDNPGELGDQWMYMSTALHESLHAINPFPIYSRSWLREGWSQYYQYNILTLFNDINQETADTYIYQGKFYWNWEDYVANDYRDYYDYEIQESAGYDITAWMLSMLRDDYSLPWESFYSIMDNNPETLDKSWELGGGGYTSIFTDTHIIDLFERAIGVEMEPVFRYDGPGGPGWGVRQWESLDWYADLTPVLEVSDTIPNPGDTIWLNATVYNNGDVGLNDVVVRFYSNDSLINEQATDVDSSGFTTVNVQYTASEGDYVIRVIVDEDDLKIETDDSNNEDSVSVSFEVMCGDVNGDGVIELGDVVYLINYLYRNGDPPIPMEAGDCNCDGIIELGDIVYLINYLYRGGDPPDC